MRNPRRRRQRPSGVPQAPSVRAEGRSGTAPGNYYSHRVTEAAAPLVIAIDGPSGSGKSSVSRPVAREAARLARRARELHGEAHDEAVHATRDQIVRRDRDDSSVSQFMQAAPGVDTVDTSDLDFEQSVQAVLDVVAERAGRVRA